MKITKDDLIKKDSYYEFPKKIINVNDDIEIKVKANVVFGLIRCNNLKLRNGTRVIAHRVECKELIDCGGADLCAINISSKNIVNNTLFGAANIHTSQPSKVKHDKYVEIKTCNVARLCGDPGRRCMDHVKCFVQYAPIIDGAEDIMDIMKEETVIEVHKEMPKTETIMVNDDTKVDNAIEKLNSELEVIRTIKA